MKAASARRNIHTLTMKTICHRNGFSAFALVAIIVGIIAVAGVGYYATSQPDGVGGVIEKEEEMVMNSESMIGGEKVMNEGEMMKKEGAMMGDEKMMEESTMKYERAVLAGSAARLLDFTKADYDAALKTDKLIVLYFYANWCPICKKEFPKMQEAFNELSTDDVIGFRVNYNDNETDAVEKGLAREFGVAYQHTKVFLKNGVRILKSPESWEKDRYLSEINSRK